MSMAAPPELREAGLYEIVKLFREWVERSFAPSQDMRQRLPPASEVLVALVVTVGIGCLTFYIAQNNELKAKLTKLEEEAKKVEGLQQKEKTSASEIQELRKRIQALAEEKDRHSSACSTLAAENEDLKAKVKSLESEKAKIQSEALSVAKPLDQHIPVASSPAVSSHSNDLFRLSQVATPLSLSGNTGTSKSWERQSRCLAPKLPMMPVGPYGALEPNGSTLQVAQTIAYFARSDGKWYPGQIVGRAASSWQVKLDCGITKEVEDPESWRIKARPPQPEPHAEPSP